MTRDELKQRAHDLPLRPGVYLMRNQAGTVIYVGKAKALKNRVSQYFQDSAAHTEKTRAMIAQIDHFEVILAESEFEALVLECALIKRHQPHYNILLKDGKGYPYIRLSMQETYPRFSLVSKPAEDGARYFGPFGNRGDSQSILDALRAAFQLPTCTRVFPRDVGKERPCLQFHMERCTGYCREEVPPARYQEAIQQVVGLLEGKFGEVERDLTAQMEAAAEQLAFETAAHLRDRLRAIARLGKRQKVVTGRVSDTDVVGFYEGEVRCAVSVLHYREGELTAKDTELFPAAQEKPEDILSAFVKQYYAGHAVPPRSILLPLDWEDREEVARWLGEQVQRRVELLTPQRGAKAELIHLAQENAKAEYERITTRAEKTARLLTLLADVLKLPAAPKRIEAYDISNTGASDIVSAMTVFEEGRPRKGAYRYFKLRDLAGPDDYAAMEQTLIRRFQRIGEEAFGARPDLLFIDGGATHVAVAERVLSALDLSIPVFGMVKDERHRTRALMTADGHEISLQANPALFAFVGQMQEETHRAAITFHRKQRSKNSYGSILERIPGIGAARRKLLLRQFKSIKALRAATLEDLEAILPQTAAQAVYAFFRTKEE